MRSISSAVSAQSASVGMTKKSAGILMFRRTAAGLQLLLIHPGGPFWSKRDLGAWSIPKGEYADGEEPDAAARREFLEETGSEAIGKLLPLGTQRQPSGKMVTAFALQGDFEPAELRSNLFEMEWPPRGGTKQYFPEADRAEWFAMPDAQLKIIAGLRPFLDRLQQLIAGQESPDRSV